MSVICNEADAYESRIDQGTCPHETNRWYRIQTSDGADERMRRPSAFNRVTSRCAAGDR